MDGGGILVPGEGGCASMLVRLTGKLCVDPMFLATHKQKGMTQRRGLDEFLQRVDVIVTKSGFTQHKLDVNLYSSLYLLIGWWKGLWIPCTQV